MMDKKPVPAIPHPVALTLGGRPYIYNVPPDPDKLIEVRVPAGPLWLNKLLSKFKVELVKL
jgi:hypothetical protein